jgi:hypothetical protein
MTRVLAWNRRKATAGMLALAIIAGLTCGTLLLTGGSSEALAAELASNSSEVQNALSSDEVRVLSTEIEGDQAVVLCQAEAGGQVVAVEVDLGNREVTEVRYEPIGEPSLPDPEMEGEVIKTTTDKSWCEPGEEVAIQITNISPEAITGGGVYYSVYDMEGNLVAGNGLFLAFDWESGEGLPGGFTWDLTDPANGESVSAGTYVILGKAGDYTDGTLIQVR